MLWTLAVLWEPLHNIAVVALLVACLRLFGPDVVGCLDWLADRCRRSRQQPVEEYERDDDVEEVAFECLNETGGWSQRFVSCYDEAVHVRLRAADREDEVYHLADLNNIELKFHQQQEEEEKETDEKKLIIQLDFISSSVQLSATSHSHSAQWLQQVLLPAMLAARPELTTPRQRVEDGCLLEKLRAVTNCDEVSQVTFSTELLVKLLKEFGVFVTRGDLKAFLTCHLKKSKPETLADVSLAVSCMLNNLEDIELFNRFAMPDANGCLMSLLDLQRFASLTQGESLSLPDACLLLKSLPSNDPDLVSLLLISRRDFRSLLNSKTLTMPLKSEMLRLNAPLDRPITDYFVSTSHNTYLMEDQIKGRSDCQAYENALRKNCRCIELDIHNGAGNDPVITHGGTMTSRIRFEDAIITIRRFAFVATDYPLVLSFENHCGIEQQEIMANILMEHMSDCLYSDENAHLLKRMPSPEDLKGKIIIKNKKLQSDPSLCTNASATSLNSSEDVDEETDDESDLDTTVSASETSLTPETAADEETEIQQSHNRSLSGSALKLSKESPKKYKKLKVAKLLSDMVSVCRPVKFKGQKYAREHYLPIEMSSLVESKMDKKQWTKKDGEDGNKLVLHTQYQLVRVYPSGMRTTSSNYNPVTAWRYGCQMVALNYQTRCENMELNDGLFQLNGGCGYVPKPQILTDPNTEFNPLCPNPSLSATLRLDILHAVNLRVAANEDKPITPYVKATLFGVPGDEKKDQTKRGEHGYNPRWNYRCFHDNSQVKVPDLAHLRLEVKDKTTGRSIGQFTAPLVAFNKGHRRIFLKDQKDCPTLSELWIEFLLTN